MVKLLDNYLLKGADFATSQINVPTYDQTRLVKETAKNPIWVHFGGGNLFRCFHAAVAQKLIEAGEMKSGVVVAETYDDEIISKVYHPFDNRFLQVITKADGQFDTTLLTSVVASYYFNPSATEDWAQMMAIFINPSLQFATFSITEKGYNLWQLNGELLPQVELDIKNGPTSPQNNMAGIAALLYHRYQNGKQPIAMVSTDNFSQNGDKLKKSILTIANGWVDYQKVDKDFISYLSDHTKVSFPLSMIDRITPNPAQNVADKLRNKGFVDTTIIHTTKNTNIAPFGNTEETHYLVIEDDFPNGRPDLSIGGVYLVPRETVNDADEMKVTTCLNPLHTALAILGCLLGYRSIAAEMQNVDLVNIIEHIGYAEGLPVVKNPGIIDPRQFINEVVTKRLPNPYIPDTPQRIATDTSQKVAIRYGVTIQHYVDSPELQIADLVYIPFVIAAWCRYLLGINDEGNPFEISPDPMADELQKYLSGISLGKRINVHAKLQPILSNASIFGCDLYQVGLGGEIENDFERLIARPGAVATAINKLNSRGNQKWK